jgi:deoxycytidine triphosphate deaminase
MLRHIAHNKVSGLTGIIDEDIQPNAVDVKVAEVREVNTSIFALGRDGKKHRGSRPLKPSARHGGQWWRLNPGAYEIVFYGEVTIGPHHAGIILPRSTLIRNGVTLFSGLYDSGYKGKMVATLYVTTAQFDLELGTRLGQFVLYDAESGEQYDGSYGEGTEHDEKYSNTATTEVSATPVKRGRGRPRKNP